MSDGLQCQFGCLEVREGACAELERPTLCVKAVSVHFGQVRNSTVHVLSLCNEQALDPDQSDLRRVTDRKSVV